MSRTEKLAVFTACVIGLSLTAGVVDMMVSESDAISWRASTAGQQSLYGPPSAQQQIYTPPPNSAIFACVQQGNKWKIVDGNTASPLSAPLFDSAKACMKQVNNWSTP